MQPFPILCYHHHRTPKPTVPFDIVQKQPVPAEKVVKGRHREVAEMLMVDGIELDVFDELQQVWKRHVRLAVATSAILLLCFLAWSSTTTMARRS